jgi:hypothetical protein
MSLKIGVSVLSTAGLVGTGSFLFSKNGVWNAVDTAAKLGLGIQLLPLSTPRLLNRAKFEGLLSALKNLGITMISFEDRWGGDRSLHPWVKDLPDGKFSAIPAYYLLFPLRYREVEARIALIKKYFPDAIGVDLPGGPREIDLHKGWFDEWMMWFETEEAQERGVVLDTFHLQELARKGTGLSDVTYILNKIFAYQVPVKLLQIQFRKAEELQSFLSGRGCDTTSILKGLRNRMKLSQLPIIIKLTPELAREDMVKNLKNRIEMFVCWEC